MRPILRLLDGELRERIISEGRDLVCNLGVEIHNQRAVSLLVDHGARFDAARGRVFLTQESIDTALASAAGSFTLYDSHGDDAVHLGGDAVNFVPGSSAIAILDSATGESRSPTSADYVRYARLCSAMRHIASQSTAMVPSDVHERISDSYRLYLSLMTCEKPVITGTFSSEAFAIMRDLLVTIRGSREALAGKPLAVFTCCPLSPLKWSDVTSQNLLDCAAHSIPVEIVPMPLAGFTAPVTLVGTLVQHTAEALSGLVMSQLANPGTPVLYGGSSAVFDVRYETTPMGDVGTMMIACACNEIGKALGLPTQAYIGLSDAKLLDAQAGLESSMGATLAALSGINSISGPGMLDFESCFSLEKLVLDNEICGMTGRLVDGVVAKEDFPSRRRFEELLAEQHLLISDHTRRYLREEIYFPGPTINRANLARWAEEGSSTLGARAAAEVVRLLGEYEPTRLDHDTRQELKARMERAAAAHGMDRLPVIE